MKTDKNGRIIVDGKTAVGYLKQYRADWIPGMCSIAVVLREICEQHPDYIRAAVEEFLSEIEQCQPTKKNTPPS